MKSNKYLILALGTMLLFVFLSGASGATQFINIGTAASGGSWYPIGLGIAEIWDEDLGNILGIRVSAQATAGAPENIDMLRKGEIDFALMNNISSIPAWEGTRQFEGRPFRDMRSITKLNESHQLAVVLSKYYKTGNIRDIEGLTYNVGAVGSGISFEEDLIQNALGIKISKKTNLNTQQAGEALRDGRIDGANMAAVQPNPTLVQLLMSGVDVKLLTHSEEDCKKINSVIDCYFVSKIPANTFPGQTEDLPAIAQPVYLVARKDLDDELVYQLTKSLFTDPTRLANLHSAMRNFKLETALEGLKIPLHPGAVRFYKEKGIEIPERLMP